MKYKKHSIQSQRFVLKRWVSAKIPGIICLGKASVPILSICILSVCLGSACSLFDRSWKSGAPYPLDSIKLGVLYISDYQQETSGYTYAHALGIQKMQRTMRMDSSQIISVGNVSDTDPIAIESAMRSLIAQGANVIIATSWGYMDTCEKLAAEFPRVLFSHASGYKRNDTNFTNFFGRIYHARYLSGIVAGLRTKTNRIGYVAAMGVDNSEVTGGINAFALGVERVNPQARIFVRVTYSWFDPIGETNAARQLIAQGCDIIAQHCDSALPQLEAGKAGLLGIGYNSDMNYEMPGVVLTSVIWNWDVYYIHLIRSIVDGSFNTAPYFGGLAEGMVDIMPLNSDLAEPGTEAIIAAERKRLVDKAFNVFDGVLRTNDGRRIGQEGETLSDEEIKEHIAWYYHTVTVL